MECWSARCIIPDLVRCKIEIGICIGYFGRKRPERNSQHLVNMFPNSSEYLDEHPCLCTSRFRHILHQLDHDRHKKLADLCSELQKLTMVSQARLTSKMTTNSPNA